MAASKPGKPFLGRDKELDMLEKRYRSNQFQFVAIHGRRRIGKTALLREFAKGKACIFFTATQSGEAENLSVFSQAIQEYETCTPTESCRSSFPAALREVFELSKTRRLLLILDEYPYLAKDSKGLSSQLQILIDEYHAESQLFLILCGSSLSCMEAEVLAYKAPLYGRNTREIPLQPLSFREISPHLTAFTPEERAMLYGMVGGTPYYLSMIDRSLSLEENLKQLFLEPDAPLLDEPETLLRQELVEPSTYNAILAAIAKGAARLSEIADRARLDTATTSVYLRTLIHLGYVTKSQPYGELKSRRATYAVADPLFRFWRRFVRDSLSLIHRGGAEQACARIMGSLSAYMGPIFERICEEYLWDLHLQGKCPISFHSLGRWWGSDPAAKKQVEIDLMGEEDQDRALFAACKWTEKQVDLSVLRDLERASYLFLYTRRHYFLFSRTGFTAGCMEEAASRQDVSLVELKDMV